MRIPLIIVATSLAACTSSVSDKEGGEPAAVPAVASSQASASAGAEGACEELRGLSGFPIQPTKVTEVKYVAAGAETAAGAVPLPSHCLVRGIVNERVGEDGFPYGVRFEVRLPMKADWNGRFLFQGGGATEGDVPPAFGLFGVRLPTPENSGTKVSKLASGWAVATQDGGHNNKALPSPWTFMHERQAYIDFSYNALDVTTQTAKSIISSFYGTGAKHSYFHGCSQGGRQGLVMATRFPNYFDGIVAADGDYNAQARGLQYANIAQAIKAVSPTGADGKPQYFKSFPPADRALFKRALYAACDTLDGTADNVIDNQQACNAKFDPATFKFPQSGAPLQCSGAKTPECLSSAQVTAIKRIQSGPRDSKGQPVRVPVANQVVSGFPYDGALLDNLVTHFIGTPDALPAMVGTGLKGQSVNALPGGGLQQYLNYFFFKKPEPPEQFDNTKFDFDKDIAKLNDGGPYHNFSATMDASAFAARGGKFLIYHGASTPTTSIDLALHNFRHLSKNPEQFARLFYVPNMAHCRGGSGTDQFDALDSVVTWVEQGKAPEKISAFGTGFDSAPTTRSRPICAYPTYAKFVGRDKDGLAEEKNYVCAAP